MKLSLDWPRNDKQEFKGKGYRYGDSALYAKGRAGCCGVVEPHLCS